MPKKRSRAGFSWKQEYGGVPAWGIAAGVGLLAVILAVPAVVNATTPAAAPYVRPSDAFSEPTPTGEPPGTPQSPEAMVALEQVRAAVDDGTLVYIGLGDSTRDGVSGPSPFYYETLRAELPLPAENIVSLGMNGATLRYMLDDPEWLARISEAASDRPTLVDLSALTNDVRSGGLGTTADEISANGAALLQEAIDQLRTLPVTVKLTVPAPYLADGEWITGVNPGVASEGVRAAFLAAAAANPDVILQDAQAELFGFTTDRPMDGDQLHPGPQAQAALAGIVATMLR